MPHTDLKEGTHVRFTAAFLKSTGCLTGDLPFMVGRVVGVRHGGKHFGGNQVVDVDFRTHSQGCLSCNLETTERKLT